MGNEFEDGVVSLDVQSDYNNYNQEATCSTTSEHHYQETFETRLKHENNNHTDDDDDEKEGSLHSNNEQVLLSNDSTNNNNIECTSIHEQIQILFSATSAIHDEINNKSSLRRILSTGDIPDEKAAIISTPPEEEEEENNNGYSIIDCTPAKIAKSFDNGDYHQKLTILNNEDEILQNTNIDFIPDDDSTSTSSVSSGTPAYFDPTDFDVSTWKNVVNDASTLGFAVVALAAAITHPLLFVAGAIAAFGTAAAAHRGYDICSNPSSSSSHCQSWFCFEFDLGNDQQQQQTIEGLLPDEEEENYNNSNNKTCCKDETDTEETSSSTLDELKTTVPAIVSKRQLIGQSDNNNIMNTSTKTNNKHSFDNDPSTQQEWINNNYPPLKNNVITNGGELVGINVVEYFHVFFDDDAPYNFRTFQEKRGDINITYGPWTDVNESIIDKLSLHPSANKPFLHDVSYHSLKDRTLTFKAKTNAMFGPAYASTTKIQRMLLINKRLAILESKTILSDIPYSDRFYVMERWIVTALKDNGRYVTHVTASCEAIFTQNCPFETQIRSRSTTTIKDVITAWCTMATEALILTEKAKIIRLKKKQNTDHHHDCSDTEDEECYYDNNTQQHPTTPTRTTTTTTTKHSNNNDNDAAIEIYTNTPSRRSLIIVNDQGDPIVNLPSPTNNNHSNKKRNNNNNNTKQKTRRNNYNNTGTTAAVMSTIRRSLSQMSNRSRNEGKIKDNFSFK